MRPLASLVLLAALAGGCAQAGQAAAPSPTSSTTTTTAPSTTTTTTAPPTTTTTAPPSTTAPADPTLRRGHAGDAVVTLQSRLVELGYWLGEPDGTYGHLTEQAVLAFQKTQGIGRDGVAGPGTLDALAAAQRPMAASTVDGIEIDLERQLLLVVSGGQVQWAINTSTGRSGWRTPAGTYAFEREIDGLRRAPLGDLYRPKYFHGGLAVHGAASIPGEPASHGCARVSSPAMDMLWSSGFAPLGAEVRVY